MRLRPALSAALVAAVVINLALFAAYLWSRGGQETRVRVEASGDFFVVYLDGRLSVFGELPDVPESGGLSVTLYDPGAIPSLPQPRGLDRIEVFDINNNQLLLRDDFDDPALPGWQVGPSQLAVVEDGMVRPGRAEFTNILTLTRTDADFSDVAVELTYRNITHGELAMRTSRADPGATSGVTPPAGLKFFVEPFRDVFLQLGAEPSGQFLRARPAELDRVQITKGIVAMALRPYPWVLGGLLAFALIAGACAWLLRGVDTPADVRRAAGAAVGSPWPAVALANFVFATALIFIYRYGDAIPHWPDAVAYIWQAKIFASGRIAAPAPPVPESFDFFHPPLVVLVDGRWSSIFPYGNSLVLLPGQLIGAPWIIPPIVGALSVVALWLVARRMYGPGAALLATFIFAASPFVLMQNSNFMSHGTAVLCMLAALFCLQRSNAGRRPLLFGVLAGLAFSLMFGVRPLPAVMVALPLTVVFAGSCWPHPIRRENLARAAAIGSGLALGLAIFLLFNYGTTGNPFESTYRDSNTQRLGFDGPHTLAIGLQNQHANLAALLLVLHAWPTYVGLGFALIPLVLASRNRWDWFCGACALLLVAAPVLFIENGIMQGPRMWYEATPFLCILAARGALLAAGFATATASALAPAAWSRVRPAEHAPTGTLAAHFTSALAVALVAALVVSAAYTWLLGQRASWSMLYVPATPEQLRGFNDASDDIDEMVREARLQNALVLVKACPHWQCYGTVFWKNNVTLDGNVVYAKDLPEKNADFFRAYPGRYVFVADYNAGTLLPWGKNPGEVPPVPTDPTRAPLARDIVLTPVATPPAR